MMSETTSSELLLKSDINLYLLSTRPYVISTVVETGLFGVLLILSPATMYILFTTLFFCPFTCMLFVSFSLVVFFFLYVLFFSLWVKGRLSRCWYSYWKQPLLNWTTLLAQVCFLLFWKPNFYNALPRRLHFYELEKFWRCFARVLRYNWCFFVEPLIKSYIHFFPNPPPLVSSSG